MRNRHGDLFNLRALQRRHRQAGRRRMAELFAVSRLDLSQPGRGLQLHAVALATEGKEMKIAFTVLGECCSMKNQRQLVSFGGKPALIKSAKAREYEKTASLQIPPAARQMLTGPVRVTMRLYYASERPDLDGALLLDIMAAKYKRTKGKLVKLGDGQYAEGEGERVLVSKGVYENDRQVREQHFFHFIDRANPRAEVEIEPMEAQQPSLLDAVPVLQTAGSPDPF